MTLKQQFDRLSEEQKTEVIAFAKRLMKQDSFFVDMLQQKGEEVTFQSALGTATNKWLKARFHERNGDRIF